MARKTTATSRAAGNALKAADSAAAAVVRGIRRLVEKVTPDKPPSRRAIRKTGAAKRGRASTARRSTGRALATKRSAGKRRAR